jgi:hypothetical protein
MHAQLSGSDLGRTIHPRGSANVLDVRNLRFKANDVTDKLSFITSIGAHLASPVDELDACHPFVYCQLGFSCKVVDVSDEARHHLTQSRIRFGAHGTDNILREVWIKAGSHTSSLRHRTVVIAM